MSELMRASEPWSRYSRMPTRAGWSYPLGQAELRAALEAADVSIAELVLFHSPNAADRAAAKAGTMALVSAKWDGRSSGLWLYAVPAERRAAARTALLSDALPRAIRWLQLLGSRGNAWGATRHDWKARLEGISVRVEEIDAEYPAAGSSVGSWPGHA